MTTVLTNLDADRQQSWAFCGMPGLALPEQGVCQPQGWPFFAVPGGMMIRAELGASETATTTPVAGPVTIPPVDPEVVAKAEKLILHFLGWNGPQPRWDVGLAILATTPIGKGVRVSFRTRCVAPVDVTIEGHVTLWPDATANEADFSAEAVWGTTATQGLSADLGELCMVTGAYPVIDHRVRKGLPEPEWLPHFQAWKQVLVTPRTWGRGSRIMWTGRLFPTTAIGDVPLAPSMPIVAVLDGWQGAWGALGALPVAPPNAATVSQQRYDEFRAHTMTGARPGDEYDDRPMGLAKQAGQTGSEDDFGCCEGEEATVQLRPWAVYDYLYQVQEWGLRPTSNREPDGSPVRAANHPRCITYNQIPFDRQSPDMLGWLAPMPYYVPGDGFTTQDDQHRSDHLLVATWLLTRDPCVGSIIDDLIELDLMRYNAPMGAPIASPRDWGRRLKSYADYVACGFAKALPLLTRTVDAMDAGASLHRITQDAAHTMRVLSDQEEKYGYPVKPDVLPWQEAVAFVGLWAAWKATGNTKARDLAIAIGETVVRHGFSSFTGDWRAAYAIRWRTDDPGMPVPDEAIPLDGPTPDHFGYAPMATWMMAPAVIVTALGTDQAVRDRAAAIVAAFPVQDWTASVWRAVRP